MNKNLRWKLLTILARLRHLLRARRLSDPRAAVPPAAALAGSRAKQLKLGLDLKGGVHLVLRVQTDEALRIAHDDDQRAAARSAADGRRDRQRDQRARRRPRFHVEGVPQDRDADFRADRRRAGGDRTTTATRRRRHLRLHDEAEHRADMREQAVIQALETIDRRVNELGVAEPNISRYGQTDDEILVQLPGVTDVGRAKEIIRNTAHPRAEDRRGRPGRHAGSAAPDLRRQGAATTWRSFRARRRRRYRDTVFYLVRKVAAVTGPGSPQRQADDRREQSSGRRASR